MSQLVEEGRGTREPREVACDLGCGATATLDIPGGIVTTADGRRRRIIYADPDIVVWDCPACGDRNADILA